MRYFTRTLNDGRHYGLYRFEVQEERILEDYWTSEGWKWDKDARVVGYLATSEPDLDEISEELAKKYFPEAFVD
jgi:hypothetical protein